MATYKQKRICVHIWTKNMGTIYHKYDKFLMLCKQQVYVQSLFISLNPILTEFVMMSIDVTN